MDKRIKTGIPGLDSLTDGGFIQNCVYLLTGETGTGKTLFGCQYIWQGLQKGEKGVYISMEESPQDIRADALVFGWDFEKYEKKGLLKILYHDPVQVDKLGTAIQNEVMNLKANRLVLDSTAAMGLAIDDKSIIRRRIASLVNTVKRHKQCTTLIITEIPEGSKSLSRFGVEEFVADGIVVLNYLGMGDDTARSLQIRKMRRTGHGMDVYPFSISKKGVAIKKGGL
ncbi:MAG: hypothetical protein ISS93_03680 [Candidatus Aenigmarchaeota archaeon]|nr:hypothetical protein [Candidatus Aenigmarchaeota archaeon]